MDALRHLRRAGQPERRRDVPLLQPASGAAARTDAFRRGDRFRVRDRGFPLFVTSQVGTDPSCDDTPHISDPREAWLDQSYSKGRFLLQPEAHRIRVQFTVSPFGGAIGWLRADPRPVGQ